MFVCSISKCSLYSNTLVNLNECVNSIFDICCSSEVVVGLSNVSKVV